MPKLISPKILAFPLRMPSSDVSKLGHVRMKLQKSWKMLKLRQVTNWHMPELARAKAAIFNNEHR